MTDDDFARGLSLNDDDDKMSQLYDAAQMEDPDFFGGGLNGYDGKEIEGVGDETVPRLNSIFDHPLITKISIEENGRLVSAWKCGFCTSDDQGGPLNNIFKGPPNATKALKHVTRILEARQTAKYKGLKFYDIDSEDNRVMTARRMVFRKERGQNTFDVFATMPGFNVKLPDDSPENDAFWQPWEVNEDLFDCLRAYYKDVPTDNIRTYDIGEGCDSDTE